MRHLHVCSTRDGYAVEAIADEVERLYGFGVCIVTLGAFGSYGSGLYIDCRFPTAAQAFEYARELYTAALCGGKEYQAAIRR